MYWRRVYCIVSRLVHGRLLIFEYCVCVWRRDDDRGECWRDSITVGICVLTVTGRRRLCSCDEKEGAQPYLNRSRSPR